MSITQKQAADLIAANYNVPFEDDEEWWFSMIEMLTEFPSVKALRREQPEWRVPPWWPGARGQIPE